MEIDSKLIFLTEDELIEQLSSLSDQDIVSLKAKIESERRSIDALLTNAEKRGNYDQDWHVRATRAYRAKGVLIFNLNQELAKRKNVDQNPTKGNS